MDRRCILKAVEEYTKQTKQFEAIIDQNQVLKPLAAVLKNYGIMTLDHLRNDIKSVDDVRRITEFDEQSIQYIWNQIQILYHPIDYLQERHKQIIMGTFCVVFAVSH